VKTPAGFSLFSGFLPGPPGRIIEKIKIIIFRKLLLKNNVK